MQTVDLNLIPGAVMPVVNVTQYDVLREFGLHILNENSEYSLTGKSLTISGRKADKNGFQYTESDTVGGQAIVSKSGSTATIRTTQQMTAAAGDNLVTLTIKSGASTVDQVSVLNFILRTHEHPLNGVVVSESDLPDIIAEATEQMERAEAAADIATSVSLHPAYIGSNGNWYVWSMSQSAYVDSGVDASITVHVDPNTVTLPPSSPAQVQNTGTLTDPVFKFSIPRGADGTGSVVVYNHGLVIN